MQTNHTKEIWECVLHLRGTRLECLKLAYRAHDTKGITWSLSKVRPTNTQTSVLPVQHKSGGKRRRVLSQDDTGSRSNRSERNHLRQTKNSESKRPLSKINRPLSKTDINTLIKLVKRNIELSNNQSK